MMYSSVGDEDRRRADQVKQDRDNLEYRAFNGNDVTATMNDITETGVNQITDGTPRSPKFARSSHPVKPKNHKIYQ